MIDFNRHYRCTRDLRAILPQITKDEVFFELKQKYSFEEIVAAACSIQAFDVVSRLTGNSLKIRCNVLSGYEWILIGSPFASISHFDRDTMIYLYASHADQFHYPELVLNEMIRQTLLFKKHNLFTWSTVQVLNRRLDLSQFDRYTPWSRPFLLNTLLPEVLDAILQTGDWRAELLPFDGNVTSIIKQFIK